MILHGQVHIEVILAALYAVFLYGTGKGLEWFGRHSHRRSGQFRTAGFTYHRHLDAWQCPTGHHLHRVMDHPHRRRTRYRAPAHVCNGCPYRANCTDSTEGREIEVSHLSWIETESGRFHGGLSFVLLVLAAFLLTVEWWRFPSPGDRLLLGGNLAVVLLVANRRIRHYFALRRPAPTEALRAEMLKR